MTTEKRFEIIHEENTSSEGTRTYSDSTRIIRDRETGVCYLYQWSGAGGGLTVLVDKDGKPLVIPEST